MMYKHGWFQVAYERDIRDELTAVSIDSTRLLLINTKDGIQAYGADCPHRGVNLAFGGKLKNECIVCPFHGYRIGLGNTSRQNFRTPAYETLSIGGLIFVRLSDQHDNGFRTFMTQLTRDHVICPGFKMPVKAPASLVTENGFDNTHFPAVHGILNTPKFNVQNGEQGELVVTSLFKIPSPDPRQRDPLPVPYMARTFSPGLIVVQLKGETPYTVLTATTPVSAHEAHIHLSLLLPIETYGPIPPQEFVQQILAYSRMGLEDDQVMWESMSLSMTPKYVTQDASILQFHEFCHQFNGNGNGVA